MQDCFRIRWPLTAACLFLVAVIAAPALADDASESDPDPDPDPGTVQGQLAYGQAQHAVASVGVTHMTQWQQVAIKLNQDDEEHPSLGRVRLEYDDEGALESVNLWYVYGTEKGNNFTATYKPSNPEEWAKIRFQHTLNEQSQTLDLHFAGKTEAGTDSTPVQWDIKLAGVPYTKR